MSKPSNKQAILQVIKELSDMDTLEFKALLDKHEQEMKDAVIKGEFNWGALLWYAENPEAYEAWYEQVKAEHARNGKATT